MPVLLIVFAVFLVLGNFLRFLPLAPFPSHFSIAEALLYLSALPYYLNSFRKSQLLLLALLLYALYGTLLHGFSVAPIFYTFKLIAMVMSGVAVGNVLYMRFPDLESCLKWLIKIFTVILLLGAVIFLFCPDSTRFFLFLKNYGVLFEGDPHQMRFISPFFDPNYYAAIASIPLLLAFHLSKKSYGYLLLTLLFALSILLTWSRSGIGALLLLIGLLTVKTVFTQLPRIDPKRVFIYFAFGLLLILTLFVYCEECVYFTDRLLHIFDDLSALARLQTFQLGLSYFWQYPFFGVGYNQLSKLLLEQEALLSIDSSLLITLINFGTIPCLLFLGCGLFWSIRRYSKKNCPLFSPLYIYLLISILFTCQFNNLLYYPFWLIPIIALFTYMERHEKSLCPRLAPGDSRG